MGDVSFLTPLDALFALAGAVPLAAFVVVRRRAGRARAALSLPAQRLRPLVPVVVALALVPALVGVAAAQPVVIRERLLPQRADAQVYVVFDTSLSMSARPSPRAPSRLSRAKSEAWRIVRSLGDIPVGIASMTDRTLPHLLPTTDYVLLQRTIAQSIGIDRPPPSQRYARRATTFQALLPLSSSHFYGNGVTHRILVVFTDGESSRLPRSFPAIVQREQVVAPFFVHVWAADEHVYAHGRIDPRYSPDPKSESELRGVAALMHGRVFGESRLGALRAAIESAAGRAPATATVSQYSRVPLAPWFVLAGVVPLGFLLWRRNL